jgi:hypothetical protein
MGRGTWRHAIAVALLCLIGDAGIVSAQHGKVAKEAKEAKDARKHAREERKEARDATKSGDPDAKEERKEAREATKEAREETREARQARRDRHREVREKLRKGPLSDKDKKDLDEIRDTLRARHRAALDRWRDNRETIRDRRRKARREWIEKWIDLHKRPKVREELTIHARRMAHLKRAQHIAEVNDRDELAEQLGKLIEKENARHARRMDTLKGEK